VDRPAVPPVVAGGRRGAVGEIDGIEAPSPVGPLRSKRPFAGTFLPLADYLSRPLQPGRAPAQDRSLRASGVVRIERVPRPRLGCYLVDGLCRWTFVHLVRRSREMRRILGVALRSSAAMVRVWIGC
jgi:hypothetical protein